MKNAETRGLVLFNRHYRERDLLVKIFTESFGKKMFFIKNARKSRFLSSLQPFTSALFMTTITDDGFSFINDVGETQQYQQLSQSLEANASASYVIGLADAAVADNIYDAALYEFLLQTLTLMNDGVDREILTDIFELQLLSRFGVSVNLAECALCARRDLPMDFSITTGGCLCRDHFEEDPRRLHLDPNVVYLAGQFMEISLEQLRTISVSADRKKQLRQFIDTLYDDYTGVNLKQKKFLDSMADWQLTPTSEK